MTVFESMFLRPEWKFNALLSAEDCDFLKAIGILVDGDE